MTVSDDLIGLGCGFVAGTLVHTDQGLKPIEQIKVGDWVLSRPEDPAQGTENGYQRVTKTLRFEDKEVINFCWAHHLAGGRSEFGNLFVTPNQPVWSYPHGWVSMGRMYDLNRRIPGTLPRGPGGQDVWLGRDLVHFDGSPGERYDVIDLFKTDRPELAFENEAEDGWGLGSLVDFSNQSISFLPDELPYDYEKWGDPVNETRERYATTVYNIDVEDWHTYFVGELGVWIHN